MILKRMLKIYLNTKDRKMKDEVHLAILGPSIYILLYIGKYCFESTKADFAMLVLSLMTITLFIAIPKYLIIIKRSIINIITTQDIFNLGIGIFAFLSLVNLFFIVDMENITGSNIKLPTAVVISIISLIRFLYYKKKNK